MSRPEVDNVPDLFQMVNETLIPNRIQGIKEASEHSTVLGRMEGSETSTNLTERKAGVQSRESRFDSDRSDNLPVPVLAETRVAAMRSVQARESKRGVRPLRVAERLAIDGHSRGGQNTLSASVRDRTAQLATALDAEIPFADTEPRPVSTSLAVAKRVEASEGPERTGHKPLMRNPSADRPSRQAVLPATPFINAPSVLERTENQIAARDIPKNFDGETYEPEKDRTRLKAQLVRVRELMRDGRWRSLSEISKVTGDPESSVSARLRDLRKPKFGLWTVDRKRRTNGLWEYRLGGKGL